MFVQVTASEIALEDADNFAALSVRCASDVDRTGKLADRLADAAERIDAGHAWLRPDWLRRQRQDDVEWNNRLDAMIAYAASKGWVDEATGAVRAHVETDHRADFDIWAHKVSEPR